MSNPLISIVIPTHNRARYAVPTLQCVLSIPANIEVVVSDTSTHDHISEHFVNDPAWSRVRLVRPTTPLSVVDNFNEGLRQASGDYLLFLGDDDFVTPEIVELLVWAKRNQVDAIQLKFPAHYYWPDFIHRRRGNHHAGTLHFGRFSGLVTRHNAKAALKEAAKNLGGGVFDMPRAYAGIISKKLAERIIDKHDSLFGGVSPDIYSAALIADSATHCVCIDYPIVIPGSSGASTAGQSANGKHVSALRDNPHIGAFKNLVWDELVPEFYSVPTVWSYSLMRALAQVDTKAPPNYGRLYIRCLFYHRAYWAITLKSISAATRKVGSNRLIWMIVTSSGAEIKWIVGKLLSIVRVKIGLTADKTINNIQNSAAACEKITEILKESGKSLQLPQHLIPLSLSE